MRSLSYEEYGRLSAEGGLVPVFREVPGDLLTPVSAFQALAARSERAFLLESVIGGERVARYSFLGRDPRATLVATAAGVRVAGEGVAETKAGLVEALRAFVPRRAAEVAGLPRFTGGAVGYLAYDAVRAFEPRLSRSGGSSEPIAAFSLYASLVAFDHVRQRLILIANAEAGSRAAYARATDTLDRLESDLRPALPEERPRAGADLPDVPFTDGEGYQRAVRQAQEHIGKGDVFQVVLSRQQTVPCPTDPFAVYRALRMVNPSPYMYFLKDGETAVAGASPEMLVRVEGRRVETRPIAGTRPRGADEAEDEALGRELLADPKERAEHLMLIDLGRNDVGRVCRFGSVAVPQLMEIERYSHVAHIVSTVSGELSEGKDALDALVAAFPAGTLTGAPKIRAMEIIDALEPVPRGIYGGALGYLDFRGNLDFCIAIRTLVLRGGRATLQAGAGIVADSDPAAEQRETEAKAGAMLEALRLARELQ